MSKIFTWDVITFRLRQWPLYLYNALILILRPRELSHLDGHVIVLNLKMFDRKGSQEIKSHREGSKILAIHILLFFNLIVLLVPRHSS
jgi:hypothetical protein